MSASEISRKLGLGCIPQRWWRVQACCASSGDGLLDGLDWLCGKLHDLHTEPPLGNPLSTQGRPLRSSPESTHGISAAAPAIADGSI
mmetsp:Transcript_10884/g.23337  ORF Transcript_10884/g.23337 Transcript_10884/m.23337 type:complete len:87 (+) Transcript_10884:538-798(+)